MTEDERAAFDAETQRCASERVGSLDYLLAAASTNRALIGREADPGDGDDEYAFVMAQAQTA